MTSITAYEIRACRLSTVRPHFKKDGTFVKFHTRKTCK